MAESVAQNSITSGISAEKRPVSKRSGKSESAVQTQRLALRRTFAGRRSEFGLAYVFEELARLAELSEVEREFHALGFRCIAGTDEVGRGALAGPVVAAAVILDCDTPLWGVNDSKLLTCDGRQACSRFIISQARAVALGVVEPHTIDRINILEASKLAMRHAVDNLFLRPDLLLLDAVVVESLEMPQVPLIEGDRRSVTIAAASIVAKVYRDFLMESYHALYPEYGFAHNRGYGTEDHLESLRRIGRSPIHRLSFEHVEEPVLFD